MKLVAELMKLVNKASLKPKIKKLIIYEYIRILRLKMIRTGRHYCDICCMKHKLAALQNLDREKRKLALQHPPKPKNTGFFFAKISKNDTINIHLYYLSMSNHFKVWIQIVSYTVSRTW